MQFYCVPVKAADRGRLTEDELCAQLMHILDDAPCLASPPPVGLLTASERNHWAEAYETLAQGNFKVKRKKTTYFLMLIIFCR